MWTESPQLLKQAVTYLDAHPEAFRIKKMLFCLCTNRWESNPKNLNSIGTEYLISRIINQMETLGILKEQLQNLVKTVNKPHEYIEIAKIVYLSLGQLYPQFHQQFPTNNAEEISNLTDKLSPKDLPPVSNDNHGEPTVYLEEALSGYKSRDQDVSYNLFDIRHQIMTYANPLRVKILLVVMLRPYTTFNTQMLSTLREYHLDDLLAEIIDVCPTMMDIETKIHLAVEQLMDVEEYGSTATGLLQAIAPLYTSLKLATK
jgi:hypothetical protein